MKQISATVVMLAITSGFHKKRHLSTHAPIESSDLSISSITLAEQVRTVDKSRLFYHVGRVSKETMKAANQVVKISMGIK